MRISIVSTLYRSSYTCIEFVERTKNAAMTISSDWELILVDDGCPEHSSQLIASRYSDKALPIYIAELSKNFGHHHAMMQGLRISSGDLVFLIDSDLEEPPELLIEFFHELEVSNADVIYGVQASRKGNFYERYAGSLFYFIFNSLSSISVPKNISVARLMRREYVNALLLMKEKTLFMAGAWSYVGFRQKKFIFQKGSKGKTSYSFSKKLSQLTVAIFSFSSKPLNMIVWLSFLIMLSSFLLFLYLLSSYLFQAQTPAGFMMLACIQLLGFGFVLLTQAIIAQYIKILFCEAKQRPATIIRKANWL